MFINESRLCKMLKKEYNNGGIVFGSDGEGTYIACDFWGVWIDNMHLSNRIKSAVVEMAGFLPIEGECFKVSKDEPEAQEYIADTITHMFDNSNTNSLQEKLYETPLLFKNGRLLQRCSDKKVFALNGFVYDIVDVDCIDRGIECEPEAVTKAATDHAPQTSPVYWINETGVFFIYPIDITNDLMDVLCGIDFSKKDEYTKVGVVE